MKLEKHLIKLNKQFSNKEEAICYCGQVLYEGGYVNEDYIEAMIERDKELSVYMGNFIAIPHGTDAAKKDVLKSGITVVQVPRGLILRMYLTLKWQQFFLVLLVLVMNT